MGDFRRGGAERGYYRLVNLFETNEQKVELIEQIGEMTATMTLFNRERPPSKVDPQNRQRQRMVRNRK